MTLTQATTTGALTGACLAFAVCMFNDITLADTVFRMFVLAIGGAWVGFLLAWLNHILPSQRSQGRHS
ncbi:MAG: hypothetical protein R8M46_09225 [Ghiorsea sp.]